MEDSDEASRSIRGERSTRGSGEENGAERLAGHRRRQSRLRNNQETRQTVPEGRASLQRDDRGCGLRLLCSESDRACRGADLGNSGVSEDKLLAPASQASLSVGTKRG